MPNWALEESEEYVTEQRMIGEGSAEASSPSEQNVLPDLLQHEIF